MCSFENAAFALPDLDSIPLPGTTNLHDEKIAPQTSEKAELPKPDRVETEALNHCEIKESLSDDKKKQAGNKVETCVEPAENSPPLNKIQMLIKQKTEKLKETANVSAKPIVKSTGLAFGVKKSRLLATEKVKFAVLKRDLKVTTFKSDSDDDDSSTKEPGASPPKQLSAEVSTVKPILISNSPSKEKLTTAEVASPNSEQNNSQINVTPKKVSPGSAKSKWDMSPEMMKTNKPEKKAHIQSSLNNLASSNAPEKLPNNFSTNTIKVKKLNLSSDHSTKVSKVDVQQRVNNDTLTKLNQQLTSPEKLTSVDKYDLSKTTNIMYPLKMAAVSSEEKATRATPSTVESTKNLSYEADSTISDERSPLQQKKSVELYSDSDNEDQLASWTTSSKVNEPEMKDSENVPNTQNTEIANGSNSNKIPDIPDSSAHVLLNQDDEMASYLGTAPMLNHQPVPVATSVASAGDESLQNLSAVSQSNSL